MQSDTAILLPHYNNAEGLLASVKSIKEEIFLDLYIVDDGSKNEQINEELIVKNTSKNVAVKFLYLKKNKGLEYALNFGLKNILSVHPYKYIARLDCGDLCHPNRFIKQLDFLYKHPKVVLLGSDADMYDIKGNFLFTLKHPRKSSEIKKRMYLNSMFIHPTVVFRTEVIDKVGFYPTNYNAAEDYAYFFKMVKYYDVANYPEVLLDYIVDPNSISSQKRKRQVKNRIKIIWDNFYLGFYPIYGLIRNTVLYFVPRGLSNKVKKIIKK